MIRNHILICGGTGCTSSGALSVMDTLNAELEKHNLQDEVKVVMTGCFGLCALGPIMIVYPEGCFYSMVKEEDIPVIVKRALKEGNPLYPVPKIMNEADCEAVIRRLMK